MASTADRPSRDDDTGEPGRTPDAPVTTTGASKAAEPGPADRPADDPAAAPGSRHDAGEPSGGAGAEPGDEVAVLVGRLTEPGELDRAERRRLMGRLTSALVTAGRKAKESGAGRGRWLADIYMATAPRVPVRDLRTLQEHHYGLSGEALADDLVRTAAKATTAVGAVGGALATAQFAAPPLLLSAPAQLVAETLVVAAIETKLIAELHEVYGVQVPGNGGQRALAFAVAWSKQRGVDPLAPGSVTIALGAAAKTALRNRLMRTLGRHLTTLGPFLTGAVAGAALNRTATRRLAGAVRADLRRQIAPPEPPEGASELPAQGPRSITPG
ncbi:hypothetical protein [Spongiactinospora sp. TRM90649]|uniref:hypothetical protein n=1 Tax=Spongiactinospora sp. TRM90649 TaxID=3031114 RepID=UPI0023F86227|nr:hypothetical protein [Spongiactinospora sp. TRM90649]MDF5757949.1 hypothetical protein [Spongiactinospora sp. TRM90649]